MGWIKLVSESGEIYHNTRTGKSRPERPMSPDSKIHVPVAEPTEEKAFQTALKLGLSEARELNKAFTDAKSKKWTTSLAFDALRQGDKIQGAKTYEVQIPSEISWGVKVIHACIQEKPSKVFYWIEKGEDGS